MKIIHAQQASGGNLRVRSRDASRDIRRFIELGVSRQTLRPGDKLPTEREIAAKFAAGRNTVRKTLDELEQEGLISREVGRGTFVRRTESPRNLLGEQQATVVADLGDEKLELVRSTSPRDLMEFRLSLEPSIAELSVERASGADIELMQRAIDQSRRAKNLQQFEDCDDALHNTIARSTRNPLFSAFSATVTEIRNQGDWGALKKKTLTEKMREIHTVEHVRIVEAIRRRDAAAAGAEMRIHLQNVRSMMFKDDG